MQKAAMSPTLSALFSGHIILSKRFWSFLVGLPKFEVKLKYGLTKNRQNSIIFKMTNFLELALHSKQMKTGMWDKHYSVTNLKGFCVKTQSVCPKTFGQDGRCFTWGVDTFLKLLRPRECMVYLIVSHWRTHHSHFHTLVENTLMTLSFITNL